MRLGVSLPLCSRRLDVFFFLLPPLHHTHHHPFSSPQPPPSAPVSRTAPARLAIRSSSPQIPVSLAQRLPVSLLARSSLAVSEPPAIFLPHLIHILTHLRHPSQRRTFSSSSPPAALLLTLLPPSRAPVLFPERSVPSEFTPRCTNILSPSPSLPSPLHHHAPRRSISFQVYSAEEANNTIDWVFPFQHRQKRPRLKKSNFDLI